MMKDKVLSYYSRVLPRDLFNESKLLKDLGFLILLIEDGMAPEGLDYTFSSPNRQFIILQDQSSGDLVVHNLTVTLEGEEIYLYHPYNDKDGPTLRFESEEYQGKVFKSQKKLSASFIKMCINPKDHE